MEFKNSEMGQNEGKVIRTKKKKKEEEVRSKGFLG